MRGEVLECPRCENGLRLSWVVEWDNDYGRFVIDMVCPNCEESWHGMADNENSNKILKGLGRKNAVQRDRLRFKLGDTIQQNGRCDE